MGRRLADVPLTAIHHSAVPRAVQTVELIRESCPDIPIHSSPDLGDYVPPVPDLSLLPEVYARFLDGVSVDEFREGATLAATAIERLARPADTLRRPTSSIVTHNFLIAWFVRHALDAPDARWLGLNQGNGALTTILYRPDRPPALVTFNDMNHLPPSLRWTGFPPELRIWHSRDRCR